MIARICFVALAFCFVGVTALVPIASTKKNAGIGMTRPYWQLQQARVVPSCNRVDKLTIRSLSSTEPESDSTTSDATSPTATTAQSTDGTYYDDEVYSDIRIVFIIDEN